MALRIPHFTEYAFFVQEKIDCAGILQTYFQEVIGDKKIDCL